MLFEIFQTSNSYKIKLIRIIYDTYTVEKKHSIRFNPTTILMSFVENVFLRVKKPVFLLSKVCRFFPIYFPVIFSFEHNNLIKLFFVLAKSDQRVNCERYFNSEKWVY